jgi:hypothetical protein
MRRLAIWLAIMSSPAAAQTLVVSPRPDAVAVTVYRDPNRGNRAFNLRWLGGFALVSEKRRVAIPAGETDLRFEGVTGGILPQSAIISGLDNRIVERNRDARLLSPGALLDASLGERVHLKRTSRATGEVREEDAIVRQTRDGVVIETAAGVEVLRCSGLAETLRPERVPADLSAKPTLSVRVRSAQPVEAEVVLSYLTYNLDWQANYVATLNEAGDRLSLFGWLTLANGDQTMFEQAATQAVAGRVNQQRAWVPPGEARPIQLSCWPGQRTHETPEPDMAMSEMSKGEEIVVTGMRAAAPAPPPPPPPAPLAEAAMQAVQEELGDLKLYRVPEPVSVAPRSQKQVALLHQPSVKVRSVYRAHLSAGTATGAMAQHVLLSRNRAAEGLGLPLPSGGVTLFAPRDGRSILVGGGELGDKAIGEEVEFKVGRAPGILIDQRQTMRSDKDSRMELIVTNDNPRPVRFEAELGGDGQKVTGSARLGRRNGRALWAVTIPANGRATLRWRAVD